MADAARGQFTGHVGENQELPLIKFLGPVSFAAHSRVTFYSPDFRFFDRELARSL